MSWLKGFAWELNYDEEFRVFEFHYELFEDCEQVIWFLAFCDEDKAHMDAGCDRVY